MARQGLTPQAKMLGEKGREIVCAFARLGSYSDVAAICGAEEYEIRKLLETSAGAAALRAEIMRQIATEGAGIGYRAVKRIANSPTAPAAAQVQAGRILLQAAGLIEAPQETGRDGRPGKSLSEMTRDELLAFMDSKRAEIDRVESELADRATPINAPVPPVS